jgi:hypothetical protein
MKTKLFNFILMGTLLVTGVVSAYTEPTANYPGGQVSPVVNVGLDQQIKSGAFWSKYLKGGLDILTETRLIGFMIADRFIISPNGFFTHLVLPSSNSQLRLGGPGSSITGSVSTADNTLFGYIFPRLNTNVKTILDTNRAPLTIDLAGRGTQGSPASRDALAVMNKKLNVCGSNTAVVTDASGVSFRSDYNSSLAQNPNNYADILARQVRLKGGNPGPNKVLVAVDNQGNATWGTLVFNPVYQIEGVPVCEDNPNYNPPETKVCGALGDGSDCPPCATLDQNRCGGIMNHCQWNPFPRGGGGSSQTVTNVTVSVQYDQSPVQIAQNLCN